MLTNAELCPFADLYWLFIGKGRESVLSVESMVGRYGKGGVLAGWIANHLSRHLESCSKADGYSARQKRCKSAMRVQLSSDWILDDSELCREAGRKQGVVGVVSRGFVSHESG